MRRLIVGNWKMNPPNRAAAVALAQAVLAGAGASAARGADLVLCPPFTALDAVATVLRGSAIGLGAQNCHAADGGAHTGDIACAMLTDLGVSHVIVGHSERRAEHGQTDEQVRLAVRAVQAAGLTPIVCVGETGDQRASGQETEIVGWQLEGSLPRDFAGVVAYEPIWAIGTGRTAGPADVATMHAFIFEELTRQFGARAAAWPLLYGGSVKPDNAASLLSMPHVHGALVGGASLQATSFLGIADQA